jgi:hypothetical protein
MAAYIFDRFPSAVRAVAAPYKLSFIIRLGVSQVFCFLFIDTRVKPI